MPKPPYDPRALANLLLDLAERETPPVEVTNLALQKLLYFTHGHFLTRTGGPLVLGGFEAWQFGPVHPAVYEAFRPSGNRPITTRAVGRNVMTGEGIPLAVPTDPEVRRYLLDVLRGYGKISVGRLVTISHAPKAPWAVIVNKAKTSVALGMRIPDNVIKDSFKHHKVVIGPPSHVGEPDEDAPFAGD